MGAPVLEFDSQPATKVFGSVRDEDFAGLCRRCYAYSGVDSNTTDLVADRFALAGMETASLDKSLVKRHSGRLICDGLRLCATPS